MPDGISPGGGPIFSERPGASILAPASYFGSSPVGGPASIFNIGGPVSQVFRTGAPLPNTLFLATLESGGPIGVFFIGFGGAPIGEVGVDGAPIGVGVGGEPIGTNVAARAGGGTVQ